MKSFKDLNGKSWTLNLTIGRARLIKSRFDIDVVGGDIGVVTSRLHNEPLTRMDLIFLLLVDKEGLKQEEFEDLHNATSYLEADEAFWEEFANFTQSLSPSRGKAIANVIEKMKKVTALQNQMAIEMAEDPKVIENMKQVINATKKKANEEMDQIIKVFKDPKTTLKETAKKVAGQISTELQDI